MIGKYYGCSSDIYSKRTIERDYMIARDNRRTHNNLEVLTLKYSDNKVMLTPSRTRYELHFLKKN